MSVVAAEGSTAPLAATTSLCPKLVRFRTQLFPPEHQGRFLNSLNELNCYLKTIL